MWIDDLEKNLDRKKAEITFDPRSHTINKIAFENLNEDNVEETVRTGSIINEKCEYPGKLCFQRYFGKENLTYIVIVIYHKYHIEIKTVWVKEGRK